jgi:hypothetical protein
MVRRQPTLLRGRNHAPLRLRFERFGKNPALALKNAEF